MIKKMRDKVKNKKGFTLVELIVVIVIILVLAAVLVPQLMKYVDKAQEANCKADAATILSQVQADYSYYQGSISTGETGVTNPTATGYTVGNVPVGTGSLATTGKNAVFSVDGSGEITSFSYYDGSKYTAAWNGTTWTITP